jgi:hypothetical protein
MDGRSIKDGALVAIKRVRRKAGEIEMLSYLSSEELRSDNRNHSVPVIDLIPIPDRPDEIFVVMPLLMPLHPTQRNPPFETVKNFVDFVRQILEVRGDDSAPSIFVTDPLVLGCCFFA